MTLSWLNTTKRSLILFADRYLIPIFSWFIIILSISVLWIADFKNDEMGDFLNDIAIFFITAAVGLAALVATFATYYLLFINEQRKIFSGSIQNIFPEMEGIKKDLRGTLISFVMFIMMSLVLLFCSPMGDLFLTYGRIVGVLCVVAFCYLLNNLISIVRRVFHWT